MLPKISVIVSIYNVESYLERCLRSLFEQTLEEMEYIFVDDGSSDGSMDILSNILQQYPKRIDQVKIISHQKNKGVAAARTTGMKVMTGEYMTHCDSDDWIDLDAYQKMYETAKAIDADIVTCRYFDEPGHIGPKGTTFSGAAIQNLIDAQYTYGLWDKIIRSSIISENRIYPFPGINYNEDLNVIVRALCHSRNVYGMSQPFYHHLAYREGSICSSNYEKSVLTHSVPTMAKLDDWLDDFSKRYGRPEISSTLTIPLKFWMKSGFYTSGNFKSWRKLWPESNKYISKVKFLSKKERILMLIRAYLPF